MRYEELSPEAINIQNQLGSLFNGASVNTTSKVAQQILLYGMYFYNGRACFPKAKSIGCGVYEISLRNE